MIEVTNLTKRYVVRHAPVLALDGVSATIPAGGYASITGPSGSGKSTLLFSMAGLVEPTSGSVRVNGQSVYDLSPGARARMRAKTMGFVFQMFYLVPYLTVSENVAVALGASGRRADGAVLAVLDRVGLTHRLNHRPGELSAGEQQRVALARALITGPRVILADEPTGNLDPALASGLLDYLDEFRRDGMTVVLATHDPAAAERAPQRIRLESGRVASIDGASGADPAVERTDR